MAVNGSPRAAVPGLQETSRTPACGDLDTAPILEARLRDAREADSSVLLDLSDCEFIDSSGLALIVKAWRDLESRDGTGLAMCCAKDQVERLLRITGAYDAISIFDSVDDALSRLS